MQFQYKFFLKFTLLGLLILGFASINPPIVYLDRTFIVGKRVENDFLGLRTEIRTLASEKGFSTDSIEEDLERTHLGIEAILEEGRRRHSDYPVLVFILAGIELVTVGFVITILKSWRSDVSRLRAGNETSAT